MWTLTPLDYDRLPGWRDDDHAAALSAFHRHSTLPSGAGYRHGAIGVDPAALAPLFERAGSDEAKRAPREFFETHFRPYAVAPDHGRGLVTAFYEPEVAVAARPAEDRPAPFLRRPADLVSVNDANRPEGWDPEVRFARQAVDGAIAQYPDREAIDGGFLSGRGLEIAWSDPVDLFFAQIQGAARLRFPDGRVLRVTFDGKSGHPFTPIGRLLVERGEIPAGEIGMRTIREWLAANPARVRALMHENRSYIFFRETAAGDPELGPVAAAKVQLAAERSLAVDRLLHTFGTPIHVAADAVGGERWTKLMMAQDTGSAIVGPARGDLFMGSGPAAGERAGNVRSSADIYILVPVTNRIATRGPAPK